MVAASCHSSVAASGTPILISSEVFSICKFCQLLVYIKGIVLPIEFFGSSLCLINVSWIFSQSIVHSYPAIVLTAFGMPVQRVLVTANKLMYLINCASFACGLLFFRNLVRNC